MINGPSLKHAVTETSKLKRRVGGWVSLIKKKFVKNLGGGGSSTHCSVPPSYLILIIYLFNFIITKCVSLSLVFVGTVLLVDHNYRQESTGNKTNKRLKYSQS